MIKILKSMLLGHSGYKDHLLKLNPCKYSIIINLIFREIEKKKEEKVPKRGDFFHVKVFRKDDGNTLIDKSSTFKFKK